LEGKQQSWQQQQAVLFPLCSPSSRGQPQRRLTFKMIFPQNLFLSAQPSLFSFLRREQPKREAENELLMRPNELLVEQVGRLFGVF